MIWTNGVNRMWFAAAGFTQNERGDWVREDRPAALVQPAKDDAGTPAEDLPERGPESC